MLLIYLTFSIYYFDIKFYVAFTSDKERKEKKKDYKDVFLHAPTYIAPKIFIVVNDKPVRGWKYLQRRGRRGGGRSLAGRISKVRGF